MIYKKTLINLIEFSEDISIIQNKIQKINWDNDIKVILKKEHILNILKRFQKKEISFNDIILWSNLIESREDIYYEKKNRDLILDTIFLISNSEINNINEKNIFNINIFKSN